MPAKLKVRIVAGRDLPIMDRSSELTDAFVEVNMGCQQKKNDTAWFTVTKQWGGLLRQVVFLAGENKHY